MKTPNRPRELREFESLVHEIERGYMWTAYEYANELSFRLKPGLERHAVALAQLDERFIRVDERFIRATEIVPLSDSVAFPKGLPEAFYGRIPIRRS